MEELYSRLAPHPRLLITPTKMLLPSSWLSLLLFFLVIAPGLLFDLLSERRRAGLTESAFREISRTILASLVFSGFSVLVLGVVRTIKPSWMPDPRPLFQHSNYLWTNYRLVVRTLAIEVTIALMAAWLAHLVVSHRQGGASIRQVSAWTHVFKREKPLNHDAYVRVRLIRQQFVVIMLWSRRRRSSVDGHIGRGAGGVVARSTSAGGGPGLAGVVG
jgi:hypothetical protein